MALGEFEIRKVIELSMSNLKNRLGQYQFNTLVSVAIGNLFDISQFEIVKKIDATKDFFCKHPVVIIADPFLFIYKDELYLFFEEQIDLLGKGIIKMTKTTDLKQWTEPKTVLTEPFHLSYPNVFEIENQIYMMPETGCDHSIKLYKPNTDLTQWTYDKTILDGKHFVDSCIIQKDENYFLFATEYSNKGYQLMLYYNTAIDGNWKEHPQSPIANDADTARCAGAVFYENGKLYRPCQLTSQQYGEGVVIYEIETLSTQAYQEKKIKQLIPNTQKEYRLGGHHFNHVNWNGKQIVATDVLELRFNFWEVIRRLTNKLLSKN